MEKNNIEINRIIKTDWMSSAVLALSTFVYYFISPTRLYNLDSLITSWRISTSGWLENFYPHHLLYVALSKIQYLITPGSESITPIYILQGWNASFGGLSIGISFLFARRLGLKRIYAIFFSLIMGFSFTFAHWSKDANPYIMVNLFIIISVWLAYEYYLSNGNHIKFLQISGFLIGISALVHQMALIFILPALYIILFQINNINVRKIKVAFTYLAIALIPVVAGYSLVSGLVYSGTSLGNPMKLFFFHGSNPQNWIFLREGFPEHLPAYIYHGILGHYSLFVFSAGPGIYEIFQSYAVEGWENGSITRYILPLIVMVSSLVMLVKFLCITVKEPDNKYSFFAVWIIPLFVFLLLWNPGYAFHRVFYLFPFLFVTIKGFQSKESRKWISYSVLAAIMLFLFVYNNFVALIPLSYEVGEYKAAKMVEHYIDKNDLIIVTPEEEYLSRMIRCFSLCERMIIGDFPKAVPALGSVRDGITDKLTESRISELFENLIISDQVFQVWSSQDKFTVTFRLADDLEKRQIIFNKSNWKALPLHSDLNIYLIEYKENKSTIADTNLSMD